MRRYRNNILILFVTFIIICICYYYGYLNNIYELNNFCLSMISGLVVAIVVSYNDYISEWEDVKNTIFHNIVDYFFLLFNCKQTVFIVSELNSNLNQIMNKFVKDNSVSETLDSKFYDNIAFLSLTKRKLVKQLKNLDFEIMRLRLFVKILKIVDNKKISDNEICIRKLMNLIDDETMKFDSLIQTIDDSSLRERWLKYKKYQKGMINNRNMKVSR